jgi:hypothetical protein
MELSRITAAVFIALCCVQFTSANVPGFSCSGEDDGNYMCHVGGKLSVCGCSDGVRCPAGEWFDPYVSDCDWSKDLLSRLIGCLTDNPKDYTPNYDGSFCSGQDDGNYPCDSGDSPKLCACSNGERCKAGQWYDFDDQECTYLTENLISTLTTCIAGGEPPYKPDSRHTTTVQPGDQNYDDCPEGYERLTDGNICYKAILEAMNYDQAYARCRSDDSRAHLAYVENEDQNNFIQDYLLKFRGTSECYISGAEKEIYYTSGQRKDLNNCNDDTFVWRVDQSTTLDLPYGFDYWKAGEPNCYAGLKENCLQFRCENTVDKCYWNDYFCDYNACLLCQIEL